jgi:1,2-diacylglycerol 3-alpha-glucosyltransferase
MKIGIFTETYIPQVNGVVTSIVTLRAELEKLGHQVYIFCPTDPLAKEIDEYVLRLPSIPFVNYEERRVIVRGLYEALKLARQHDLEIIHTHTEFGAGILGKMVAKRMNIPVVHTFHTYYEDYLHYFANGKLTPKPVVKRYAKFILDDVDGVICPSKKVTDWLSGMDVLAPMTIIPTGIYVDKFLREDITQEDCHELRESLGIKEDEIMLLSLSRVSVEKNIQAIIKGFVEIHQAKPNTKLIIVGKGPYKEELERLTKELGLLDSVVFVGQVEHEEAAYYYKAADYFVFASTSETQGLVYPEAIAAGTQVIAARSEYLDGLLDNPTLGVTFVGDENFAKVALDYMDAQISMNEEVLENKLFEISSENFGMTIYEYYLETLVRYSKELREKGQMNVRTRIRQKLPKPRIPNVLKK